MKNVGVVANHQTVNYGTMLQAYALQQALEQLGVRAETIELQGISKDITRKKLAHFWKQMSKRDLVNAKLPAVKKAIRRRLDRRFCQRLSCRDEKFRAFREAHFLMSERCMSKDALTALTKRYDTVLVGSDQVWLPSNIAADVFTLSFVPEPVNTVAYASSFGVSSLPPSQEEAAKAFLNRIKQLSVREQSGRAMIQRLTGRDVPVVCDPSLLFDSAQWDNLLPPGETEPPAPYLFCYFLGNNPWQRALVKQYSNRTGLPIVMPMHMDEYIAGDERFADQARYDLGPEAFLDALRHAACVFTDSFHGTVFSILYQKDFYTFDRFRQDAALSTNTRIDSLFLLTGLEKRHVPYGTEVSYLLQGKPEFTEAHNRLQILREESWGYLERALAGGKEEGERL